MKTNSLIAYFSYSGNTGTVAGMVAELTGGTLFRIDPTVKYPGEYRACTEAAQRELREGARPTLKNLPDGIVQFDAIILGYPNWWGTMPMPVWTFLEAFDFGGKKILPFCTNEGSGMGNSARDLKALCPTADVRAGLAIRGSRVADARPALRGWLERNLGKD